MTQHNVVDPAMHDLAGLVGSRLCHDLISPLGAIGNGLELLRMTGDTAPDGPEMELIAQSAAAAQARIRFFRIAFGHAPPGLMLATAEIRAVLDAYTADSRTRIAWTGPQEVQRRDARLAFLAILCLEGVHPRGNLVRIDTDGRDWTVAARSQDGQPPRLNPVAWARLGLEVPPDSAPDLPRARPELPPPEPGEVQFALLAALCRWRRPPLAVERHADGVTLRF